MVDHFLRRKCAERSTKSVGHNHKQSLCRTADVGRRVLIHIKGARDVEEVKRHTVNNHGEDEHPHACTGVAKSKESEAQHPPQHSDHHHTLDAKFAQAEGDEQDAEGFTDLREADECVSVLCAKGIGKFGDFLEGGDEGVGISVCDLQTHPEQHGEDEEHRHLALLKQAEGIKSQPFNNAALLSRLCTDGTCGERLSIQSQQQP